MRFFDRSAKVLAEDRERFAVRIAGKILRAQRRLADVLNARTAEFSVQRWRVLLIMFCLLFGGYSLYLLVAAIY